MHWETKYLPQALQTKKTQIHRGYGSNKYKKPMWSILHQFHESRYEVLQKFKCFIF